MLSSAALSGTTPVVVTVGMLPVICMEKMTACEPIRLGSVGESVMFSEGGGPWKKSMK